jgi:hypothetical protein
MSVELIETRLPAGVSASGLGESASGAHGRLVSAHTAPLFLRRRQSYTVFVPTGQPVDTYQWTVFNEDTSKTTNLPTTVGRLVWLPTELGTYRIAVRLMFGGTAIETIEMRQRVVGLDAEYEKAKKAPDERFCPVGNAASWERVQYEFLNYIFDAVAATTSFPPARLLSAIAYCAYGGLGEAKSETVYRASSEPSTVNPLREGFTPKDYKELLSGGRREGVFRLRLSAIALHQNRITLDPAAKDPVRALDEAFNALGPNSKVDIFNLARFPKSSAILAAQMLAKQDGDWTNLAAAANGSLFGPDDLTREHFVETIASIFANGGIPYTKQSVRKGTSISAFDGGDFGKKCVKALGLPVMECVVEPTAYVAILRGRWNAAPADVPQHFDGGFVQFAWLSAFYETQHGIPDLVAFVHEKIKLVVVSFYKDAPGGAPKKVPLHVDAEAAIGYVDAVLKAELPSVFVTQMSGFVPRLIGGSSKLSNHARGLAVDFDWDSNPQLFPVHMEVLNRKCGTNLKPSGLNTYEELAQAHTEFMAKFKNQTAEYRQTEWADVPLEIFTKFDGCKGILTLPKSLIQVMEARGFGWGGYYVTPGAGKDSMHFDFPKIGS